VRERIASQQQRGREPRRGVIDLLTLFALLCALAHRLQLLLLTLRHPLRGIEPFFLRPTIMCRRYTRLL
jgi:hypothetical protein